MKRILVVLAALVLVFAVACDGDNPAPEGGSGGNGNVPGAPAINTQGTPMSDLLEKYMSDVMGFSPVDNDEEFVQYLNTLANEKVDFTNKTGTLKITGTRGTSYEIEMTGYVAKPYESESEYTVWGTMTSVYSGGMVGGEINSYDCVVKASNGDVFSVYVDWSNEASPVIKVNGEPITGDMFPNMPM